MWENIVSNERQHFLCTQENPSFFQKDMDMCEPKVRRLICTTFASKSMHLASARLERQAASMALFDSFKPYDETMLDSDFQFRFRSKLRDNIRGFGYWCWKPQVALQALAQMRDGDVLMYVDAGCHLNPRGRQRLEEYAAQLTPEAPILAFKYNGASKDTILQAREVPDWNNGAWTKEDLFLALGVEPDSPVRSDQTYHATTFMLLNGPTARQFLMDWIDVFDKDWAMIDDTPSQAANAPSFQEHRHDQSIFSILCSRYQVIDIDAREIICWGTDQKTFDWDVLSNYPVHARRDRNLSRTARLQWRWRKLQKKITKLGQRLTSR